MTTVVAPTTLLHDMVADDHDYVWARLPFLPPMAIAAARRRDDHTTRELARSIVELQPLLLGHLDREEAVLVHGAAAAVTGQNRHSIRESIRADHAAVTALIEHIRAITGTEYEPRAGAGPAERALYLELARLDDHVQAQISFEEHLMAWREGSEDPIS